MLLLKTDDSHMDGVRRNRAHASDGAPRHIRVGDWLLIQVTSGPHGNETRRVKYAMKFVSCEADQAGETKRIWGKQWRYIIRGNEFRILRRPFDIEGVQVSDTNYGQGVIRFAYVDPRDAQAIVDGGWLAGA